jgi:hypothetical protein
MTTATMARTDEQIQRDVLEELRWDARVTPTEVSVAVRDGIVTLSGSMLMSPRRTLDSSISTIQASSVSSISAGAGSRPAPIGIPSPKKPRVSWPIARRTRGPEATPNPARGEAGRR